MSEKFHVSPDLFDDDITNIYHPDSTRKLGHIIKDKHGSCIAQTTDSSQLIILHENENGLLLFSGMSKTKRRKKKVEDAWDRRMKAYHKNFDKY